MLLLMAGDTIEFAFCAVQMTWDAAAGSSARSRPMGGTPLPSPPPSPAPQAPRPAVEHSDGEGTSGSTSASV